MQTKIIHRSNPAKTQPGKVRAPAVQERPACLAEVVGHQFSAVGRLVLCVLG